MTEDKRDPKAGVKTRSGSVSKDANDGLESKEAKSLPAQDKGFLVDAAENIETGAKIVSEKTAEVASDITEKTTEIAGSVMDKIKKGASEAYQTGAKLAEGIGATAQNYSEKYKNNQQFRKLSEQQNVLFRQLGAEVAGSALDDPDFKKKLKENTVKSLISEIESLDKHIAQAGKKLAKM